MARQGRSKALSYVRSLGVPSSTFLDLGTHTDSSGVITLDFVNRYSASTTFAGIEVAKTMYGKDLEDKQFGFTLEPVDSASAQKMLDRGLPADEESSSERIFAAGGRLRGRAGT